MKVLRLTLSFTTPAFMGNAEQSAQWRTPPIKALLRQWWRVAYAANKNFDVSVPEMRHEEGLLFGHAWLEDDISESDGHRVTARKSKIRIRLDRWNEGRLHQWSPLPAVVHPEVKFPVGSDLYLGFGPLTLPKGTKNPVLRKNNAAIQADESAILSIAVLEPEKHAPIIEHTLWLMNQYGTLGGRSRNGWGSFLLHPSPLAGERGRAQRTWTRCLDLDWPHAIGQDEKGALIWQTKPQDDWRQVMKILAEIKIGLRTQFPFTTGNQAPGPRHWLSYPVTNHPVQQWGDNLRLPNTMRFKVRKGQDGKLRGVIFHVPHQPPAAFNPNRTTIEQVWRSVHAFLDEYLDDQGPALTRIPE